MLARPGSPTFRGRVVSTVITILATFCVCTLSVVPVASPGPDRRPRPADAGRRTAADRSAAAVGRRPCRRDDRAGRGAHPRRVGVAAQRRRQRRRGPDDQRRDRPGDVSRRAGRAVTSCAPRARGLPDAESSPFTVHGGGDRTGARRDAADVRPRERGGGGARELADREPAAGGRQRRADRRQDGRPAARGRRLPVAPDGAARASSAGRKAGCAIKGGAPTTGALQISSASLNDPSTGDFDLELPERRRRVGRGAVEPVRRRVRPVLDQRDAGPYQARHERVGRQARQPHARVRQGLRVRQQVRAAAVDLGAAQAGSPAVRPVPAVPVRPNAGQEPARRAAARPRQLRLLHAARRGAVVAPCADRRRHLLSRARSPTPRCRRSVPRRRRRSSRRKGSRPAPSTA